MPAKKLSDKQKFFKAEQRIKALGDRLDAYRGDEKSPVFKRLLRSLDRSVDSYFSLLKTLSTSCDSRFLERVDLDFLESILGEDDDPAFAKLAHKVRGKKKLQKIPALRHG